MRYSPRVLRTIALFAFPLFGTAAANAASVIWDVDPTASYVRLDFAGQSINVPGVGNVPISVCDDNSSSTWTDSGGRRAYVDGHISTDYTDAATIQFLGTSQDYRLDALEQTNLRPAPDQWDGTSYTGSGTASAAFGGKVRAKPLFFWLDAAYMALRSVQFNVASDTALSVNPTTGLFKTNQSTFGLSSGFADVDGLIDLVSDIYHQPIPSSSSFNNADGAIENLGGLNRKLTYNINVPISIPVNGATISGTATGAIVAYATLPEPSTVFLLILGAVTPFLRFPGRRPVAPQDFPR